MKANTVSAKVGPYQYVLLAALMALFVMVWQWPQSMMFKGLAAYLPLHTTMEVIAVVVAALVFGVGWNAYSAERPGSTVVLACVFLAVGMLDVGHLLSYKGMPEFITGNDPNKAIWFWLGARLAAAAGLLAAVAMPRRPLARTGTRYVLLGACVGYVALLYWVILVHLEALPVTFVDGKGLTTFKVASEYLVIALHLITAMLILRRPRHEHTTELRTLLSAVIVMGLSELCFTLYSNVADAFNVLGHVYKVVAYLLLWRAIFFTSVREPYEKLHVAQTLRRESEERYQDIVQSAQEGIWKLDAQLRTRLANRRLASMLGYTPEQMLGRPLADFIPDGELACGLEPETHPDGRRLDVRLRHRAGTEIWAQLSMSAVRYDGDQRGTLILVTDISERKHAERGIALRNQLLGAIQLAQSRLILQADRRDVFDNLLAEVLTLTVSEYGFVAEVCEDDQGHPYMKTYTMMNVAWDTQTKAYFDTHETRGVEFRKLDNLFGCVIRDRTVVIANDIPHDPRHGGIPKGHPRMDTFLGMPCESGGKLRGVLGIANRAGGYDQDWVELLRPVCTTIAQMLAAIAMERDRLQAQAELYAEKERAQVTLASIGDAVITTDLEGRIENLNLVAERLTGWHGSEAIGRPLDEVFRIVHEHTREPMENPARRAVTENSVVGLSNHAILLAKDGSECAIEDSAAPIRDRDGSIVGCVLVFHDVSEKRQLENRLIWQAGHDALTGLPNRALLSDRMQQAIRVADRQQRMLAVVFCDLDGFKPINDTHGHDVGDRLLFEVGQRLVRTVRAADTVARLGGDEFVVLLNDVEGHDELEPTLHRLLEGVHHPYLLAGAELRLSASIGVTVYPGDRSDADTLLRHADQAMYIAKQEGRNRFHIFDAEKDRAAQNQRESMERLRLALNSREFVLYYQPKVDMRSGKVVGAEALVRWQHPEHGLLGPMEFLPLMEHNDLIVDLGDWVIETACAQMVAWEAEGLRLPVSVNIAARQLQRADFITRLRDTLGRFPALPAHRLELEILESAALEDMEHVRNVIRSCLELGVRFALDDFGTGYSSLAYLKRLPADIIKIDRSFVRDILDDRDDRALVEGIVRLAQVFGRDVVAEGVETTEQGQILISLGVSVAQGFGIGRPMPAEALPPWVRDYRAHPLWLSNAASPDLGSHI